MVAVRRAALVSDESALEACLRRCAIQIDDLYFYFLQLALVLQEDNLSKCCNKNDVTF